MHSVANRGTFLRHSDWWNSKVAMIFGWSYFFALLFDLEVVDYLIVCPAILLWLMATASFGYYINDCFDTEVDLKAKKTNTAAQHTLARRVLILATLVLASVGSALFLFWSEPWFMVVAVSELLLFVLYSIPPFRWKEIPFLDVVTDALYAQVLPLVVVALALLKEHTSGLAPLEWALLTGIGIWALVSGIRNILEHQVADFENDSESGISNTVQSLGVESVSLKLDRGLIPLEWASFCVVILITGVLVPELLVLSCAFLLILGFTTPIGEGVIEKTKAFRSGSRLLEPRLIYEFWFPLSCLAVLSYMDWKYVPFIFLHLILFRNWIVVLTGDFLGNVVYYQAAHILWHRGLLRLLYEVKSATITLSYRLVRVVYYQGILRVWIGFKLFVNFLAYQFKFRILGDKEERVRWKNRDGRNR